MINKLYLKTLYQCKLFHLVYQSRLVVAFQAIPSVLPYVSTSLHGSYKCICKYCFQGDGVNCSQMDQTPRTKSKGRKSKSRSKSRSNSPDPEPNQSVLIFESKSNTKSRNKSTNHTKTKTPCKVRQRLRLIHSSIVVLLSVHLATLS